ncbi:MAG: hypothetical protein ACR2RF_05885 [Geminicoccaceae bacterium]
MTDTETSLDIIEKGPLPDEVATEAEKPAVEETEAEASEPEAEVQASEEEAEEEVEEEAEPKPKRRRNRTARLAAKLTQAEQQIAELRQQVQQIPQPPVEEEAPPKVEDFQKYEDYLTAHAGYVARVEVAKQTVALNRKVAEATQVVQQQQSQKTWEGKETKASEKYADYAEVVHDPDLQISTDMANALMEMPNGTDVAYHLGSHPDESARIAQLTPTGQLIELGRISAEVRRPKPKTTAAPPPVKTVKAGSAPAGLTPENARSMDDFIKARKAQEEAAGKA